MAHKIISGILFITEFYYDLEGALIVEFQKN